MSNLTLPSRDRGRLSQMQPTLSHRIPYTWLLKPSSSVQVLRCFLRGISGFPHYLVKNTIRFRIILLIKGRQVTRLWALKLFNHRVHSSSANRLW